MQLSLLHLDDEVEIVPPQKIAAKVEAVLVAPGDDFVTTRVETLELGFEGVAGDFHAGFTRRSGGREPWYRRGTEISNDRQVSIVAPDELALVAAGMGLPEIRPEWIGANMVLAGVPQLSMLPPGALLFFKGGVTLKIDGQNAPCRLSGRSVAEHAKMPDHQAGALLFPKVARRRRGLVAWVEKPGAVTVGEDVSVRIPEQWIYRA